VSSDPLVVMRSGEPTAHDVSKAVQPQYKTDATSTGKVALPVRIHKPSPCGGDIIGLRWGVLDTLPYTFVYHLTSPPGDRCRESWQVPG
jgi:hypothetical protein